MARISLDGASIRDWDSYHSVCARAFGFPDFYGRNRDAWIDCVSSMRDREAMTGITLADDEALVVEIASSDSVPDEMVGALVRDAAAVNQRDEEIGQRPSLYLVFR